MPDRIFRVEQRPFVELENRVALVTGAGSGIARATAQLFARHGAEVMVADRSVSCGMETVEKIHADGGNASFVEVDLTPASDVNRMIQTLLNELGRVDVLFNGAGILDYGTVLETTEETWNRMISINLTGTYLCAEPSSRT
jgi:NAD(P)-dependent dehydrogenase (short-subunit alcohol dehydrogenase family)